MNNKVKTQENLSACIKNSFDIVVQVYEESSFLLQELTAELEGLGFENLNGNLISTRDVKTQIGEPRYWMTRFAALFFRPRNKQDSRRILSTNISYFDLELKAMKPYLVVGVGVEVSDGRWGNPWMHHAFLNKNDMFIYYENNKELKITSPKQEWQRQRQEQEWGFKVPGDTYPDGLKAGKLFAVPLVEINNSEDIKDLAERGLKLWNTKLT